MKWICCYFFWSLRFLDGTLAKVQLSFCNFLCVFHEDWSNLQCMQAFFEGAQKFLSNLDFHKWEGCVRVQFWKATTQGLALARPVKTLLILKTLEYLLVAFLFKKWFLGGFGIMWMWGHKKLISQGCTQGHCRFVALSTCRFPRDGVILWSHWPLPTLDSFSLVTSWFFLKNNNCFFNL